MHHDDDDARGTQPLRLVAPLALAAVMLTGAVLAARALPGVTCGLVQAKTLELGASAPAAFIAAYVAASFAFVPGLAMALASGVAFGARAGALWALIGSSCASAVLFAVARVCARRGVLRLFARATRNAKIGNFVARLGTPDLRHVLALRLLPILPFTAANVLFGLSTVRTRDFLVGSLLGMLPGAIGYAYLGSAGCELVDLALRGDFAWSAVPDPLRWRFLGAAGGLAALALVTGLLARRFGARWLDPART